jgi:hypothetical protein
MRTPDSGGGGGTSGSDDTMHRRLLLMEIAADLDVHNPAAEANKPSSNSLALAILEEDTRGVVVWAFLKPFLRLYSKKVPLQSQDNFEPADVEASIKVALDQANFFLTPTLLKHHYRKLPPLGLGAFANNRFSRERANASWKSFQRDLTEHGTAGAPGIFRAARTLQLWKPVPIPRPDNGGGAIARWEISAGQALIDFDEFVFQPTREQQYRRFCERFYHCKN